MRAALFGSLGLWGYAHDVPPGAVDPQANCQRLSDEVQSTIRPAFYEAVTHPDSSAARDLHGKIDMLAIALNAVPEPPAVQALVAADKHRLLGFLRLAKARLDGALADMPNAPKGETFKKQRTESAGQALADLDQARVYLNIALQPTDPDYTPEIPILIAQAKMSEEIDGLAVTAHAILWVLEGDNGHKDAAKKLWEKLPSNFQMDNSPPAPEVVKTLDLPTEGSQNAGMTPVSWAGIGLLLIGLLAAIFVRNTSLFQQWAIRVIIAVGAALTATVIPGLLNIKISEYVAAGGTLAVIVLIYLFNPPKVE